MPIPVVRIDEISQNDIEALVENDVQEDRRLEYKRQFDPSPSGRRKLLSEISAFANTSGGDIVIGLAETNGTPSAVEGVPVDETDELKLRIQSLAESSLDPRVTDMQIASVPIGVDKAVVVIRIPVSFSAPHAVNFQGQHRFYRRTSSGVIPMETDELRGAFLRRAEGANVIESWLRSRSSDLRRGENEIVSLNPWPKVAVHIVSAGFPDNAHQLAFSDLDVGHTGWWTLSDSGHSGIKWNVDGPFTASDYSSGRFFGYTQYFRDGAMESVDTSLFGPEDNTRIRMLVLEQTLLDRIPRWVEMIENMQSTFPLLLSVRLFRVRGLRQPFESRRPGGQPIDRDNLESLPRVYIEHSHHEWPTLLRPIFDAIWNSTGFSRSLSYTEDGVWNPER